MLVINGHVVTALASMVDVHDEKLLQIEKGASAGQGVLEALAVLVAVRQWKKRLQSYRVKLVIQSDSLVALALSQRMAASTPTLNYLGAELALAIEEAGIERLEPVHIPGSANIAPDFLSRPSKWSHISMPKELHGINVETPEIRTAEFYRLPGPTEEPSMWGTGLVAAGAAAWDNLR